MSDRQKGWVSFSTFAFVEQLPTRINFLEHLLPYKGFDEDLTIPWGVYGTTSLNRCAYYATHYARARKRLAIQLTVWYRLEGVGRSMTKLPKTLAECRDFLHAGRISSDLREEMRNELLEIAQETRASHEIQKLQTLEGAPLLQRDPQLVRQYLKNHKDLLAVVHPVMQTLDTHQEEAIQIASFKLKRDHIMQVEAPYYPTIVVEI